MLLDKQTLQQLGEHTVLDEQKNAVQLSSLWRERKTVLMFIRHFG